MSNVCLSMRLTGFSSLSRRPKLQYLERYKMEGWNVENC